MCNAYVHLHVDVKVKVHAQAHIHVHTDMNKFMSRKKPSSAFFQECLRLNFSVTI
jgi:hypothetical protein